MPEPWTKTHTNESQLFYLQVPVTYFHIEITTFSLSTFSRSFCFIQYDQKESVIGPFLNQEKLVKVGEAKSSN